MLYRILITFKIIRNVAANVKGDSLYLQIMYQNQRQLSWKKIMEVINPLYTKRPRLTMGTVESPRAVSCLTDLLQVVLPLWI
jgi:hypothetical protein